MRKPRYAPMDEQEYIALHSRLPEEEYPHRSDHRRRVLLKSFTRRELYWLWRFKFLLFNHDTLTYRVVRQ